MAGRKRKRQKSLLSDIINLVTALAMIVIAVLLVVFVYFYIRNNSSLDNVPFLGRLSSLKSTEGAAEPDGGDKGKDHENESEPVIDSDISSPGLTHLKDGRLVYVLSGSERSRYEADQIVSYDADTDILASSWLESGDYLYYFDENGYAVTEHAEGAMQYRFGSDYVLNHIHYDESYRGDVATESADYPGLVRTKTLMAFLDEGKHTGDLYAIRFKKTTDSLVHELGGGSNPQYTSRYAMRISGGYIYYLALSDSTSFETIAGKLFRMMPGADYREIVAEQVRGYKVIESVNGGTRVYYDDGTGIRVTQSFARDDSMRIFPENGNYYVETDGKKATLMLEGGYPVTMQTTSFTAGNFTYSLSTEGEILSVAAKTKVTLGGYTYAVENGEAFGVRKARVLRQDSAGTIEMISAEFIGSVGNLHYDFGSSRIIAEYTAENGSAGLVSISTDGDVDLLYDASDLGSTCVLYAIQDGNAIVRTSGSGDMFRKIRLSATYPLSLGIDPVTLETDDPNAETVESEPAEYDDTVRGEKATEAETEAAPGVTAASPDAAVSVIGPGGDGSSGAAGIAPGSNSAPASVSAGPGSDGASVTVINDHVVERKGPGES